MSGPLNGSGSVGGIIIPTMIQTSSDLLAQWTGMTCVYDVNWSPLYGKVTLPICMFHITEMHEISTTQVSTKRVILYEPQVDEDAVEMAKTVRPSVLRTIADNAVRNPRTYTISGILPYMLVDRKMREFADILSGAVTTFLTLLGADKLLTSFYGVGSFFSSQVDVANKVISILDRLPNLNGISRINKESLDAMSDRTHFLCMKMWTGYDYKFVLITNLDISKKPTEDDVYRFSMQVQEMPVLSVNRPKSALISNVAKNPVTQIMSLAEKPLSDILVWKNGFKTAAGDLVSGA